MLWFIWGCGLALSLAGVLPMLCGIAAGRQALVLPYGIGLALMALAGLAINTRAAMVEGLPL